MPVIQDINNVYYPGISKQVLNLVGASTGATVLADDYGFFSSIRAQLVVTAASGTTPTLNLTLNESTDGGTTWNPIITFPQVTGPTTSVQNFTGLFGPKLQLSYTVGGTGTPTFTFSVNIFAKK